MADLLAMVRQRGVPTFFATLSAADTHWKELLKSLTVGCNTEYSDDMNWKTKRGLLKSNPVTCVRMFDRRVRLFFKEIFQGGARPLGRIIDWFFRIEFQKRGVPHVHGLIWVDGSPSYGANSSDNVAAFIDEHVSCRLPSPEHEPCLFGHVNKLQRHPCRKDSCIRGRKRPKCRFHFPKLPMAETMILRPLRLHGDSNDDETVTDSSSFCDEDELKQLQHDYETMYESYKNSHDQYASLQEFLQALFWTAEYYIRVVRSSLKCSTVLLKRAPAEARISKYNAKILESWQANVDVQYVLDPHAVIVYLTSYMMKAERELGILLRKAMSDNDPVTPDNNRQQLQRIGSTYLRSREVSVQDAVCRTLRLRMKEASREVIYLPIESNALRMTRSLDEFSTS